MPKVLVTGASGMLGKALVEFFTNIGWDVVGQYRTRIIDLQCSNFSSVKVDLSESSSLNNLIRFSPCDLVIHCAAATNLEICENDLGLAMIQNCLVTQHVVDVTKRIAGQNTKVIYISSDAVYPDVEGMKSENSTANPATAYGMTKLWGEMLVFRSWPNSLILRTTILGPAPDQFCGRIVSQALKKLPLQLFSDVSFTPISVNHLSQIILKAYSENLVGIYNVGSTDSVSKADFGIALLKSLGIDANIHLLSMLSLESMVKRSFNMNLDSSLIYKKLNMLGYTVKDCFLDLGRLIKSETI